MTPEKAAKVLQGQTALARKAFDAVPVSEWWDLWQVKRELERLGTVGVINHTQLRGCLKCLKEAGLIDEKDDAYRSAVTLAVSKPPPKPKEQPQEPPVTEAKGNQKAVPTAPARISELDHLANLSSELIDITDEIRQKLSRLTRIAKELDDVALNIAQEQQASDKRFERLNRVQLLMRELSQEESI